MTIKYAILGLLSWRSFSGYDMKKLMADSETLYWSGNNNQIYRNLVQLHNDELVTQEVQQQENYPAKKVYTITEKGRAELREWVKSLPELPDLRNTFLVQLAWADQLDVTELDGLLAHYEHEVEMQMLMQQEKIRRKNMVPDRTPREVYLWEMIMLNHLNFYRCELDWVRELRKGLADYEV